MAIEDDEEPGILVEVSGPPDSGKTIVCSIIRTALSNAGFGNVIQTDQQGAQVDPLDLSVLDMVRATRPDLFEIPIEVSEVTEVEELDVDVIELSDVTLRGDPSEPSILEEEFGSPESGADDI